MGHRGKRNLREGLWVGRRGPSEVRPGEGSPGRGFWVTLRGVVLGSSPTKTQILEGHPYRPRQPKPHYSLGPYHGTVPRRSRAPPHLLCTHTSPRPLTHPDPRSPTRTSDDTPHTHTCTPSHPDTHTHTQTHTHVCTSPPPSHTHTLPPHPQTPH